MTGDWQEDWAERREPRRSGRHSRPPQDYGDQDPYGPTDGFPQPDPYATPPSYGQPGPYPGAGESGLTQRYAVPDRPAEVDPLTAPGRFAPPDPLASPARRAPGQAGLDPYATRPHRVQEPAEPGPPYATPGDPGQQAYLQPSYPVDEPYGGRAHGRHGSAADALGPAGPGGPVAPAAPGNQNGYGPGGQNGYGQTAQNGYEPSSQNGHAPAGSYDPLTAPQGRGGYGPPGFFNAPAERGSQNGYPGVGYAQPEPDSGPYRWRPSPEEPEEGLTPLPDYHGGPESGPRPAPGDWDPPRERDWDPPQRDWDPGPDDSVGLAQPVSGPVQSGAWQREAEEREDRDEPRGWDEAPRGGGLIPGFGDSGPGSGPGPGRGGRGGKRRRVGRVLAPLLALVLLAALGAGGYKLYRHFQSPDYTGPGTGEVTVQVRSGDTATSLAPRLVKAGVVASTSSFISAAKSSSNPAGLEPGFFRLRHHMNSALAYALLLNPKSRIQSVVAVPEGLRETQILATLEQKTGTPDGAFAAALRDPATLGLPSYANGNPEGYLYPATYNFSPGTSALAMLRAMVARYNQEAASINLTAAAKTAQLTPEQVITVASILEAEAGAPKYYADVAEVIYNRLNDGMFLGLDSTVNYALHRFGVSLTQSQLHVNSPYNTFIHKGLPPGPIDSPGNAAIEAALHPAHGDLLYFVTVNVKTGLTKFATTAAGFQQLENECNQNNSC